MNDHSFVKSHLVKKNKSHTILIAGDSFLTEERQTDYVHLNSRTIHFYSLNYIVLSIFSSNNQELSFLFELLLINEPCDSEEILCHAV